MQPNKIKSKFLDLINQARSYPEQTGKIVYQTYAHNYHEEEFDCFNKQIQTFEGITALEDLQGYLTSIVGVDALRFSEPLNKVAQRIAEEKGTTSRTDHQPPLYIKQRIQEIADVKGYIGELIALKVHYGEELAYYLLLDDGLASRKRRRMLMDPKYHYIGVGFSGHKQHETIAVILLAEKVQEQKLFQQKQYKPEMHDVGQNPPSFQNSRFSGVQPSLT